MNAEIVLIITLSVILLISPFISNFLKIPVSIVEILLGSITASFGILQENELFKILAEVGFLYLMLLAGMEVNLKSLKLDKKILKKGILYLILLYFFSILSVIIFKFSLIFIAILPLISIGLLITIQQEVGKQNWLEIAIKIGVIGELLSILMLTFLSGYFEFKLSKELLFNILILFGFLIFLGIVFILFRTLLWWFPKLKHFIMPVYDKYYQDVRVAISMFFIMIAVMMSLHLDVVLGAFVVGVFLTTFFEHNSAIEKKLAPFGFGFLITIFFVHVGSNLDLKNINFNLLKDAFLVAIVMIGIRIISALVFSKELKENIISFALAFSMPLTLLIATATLAYQNHSISKYWYNVFILTSILEVAIGMFGIKLINKIKFHKKGLK